MCNQILNNNEGRATSNVKSTAIGAARAAKEYESTTNTATKLVKEATRTTTQILVKENKQRLENKNLKINDNYKTLKKLLYNKRNLNTQIQQIQKINNT